MFFLSTQHMRTISVKNRIQIQLILFIFSYIISIVLTTVQRIEKIIHFSLIFNRTDLEL